MEKLYVETSRKILFYVRRKGRELKMNLNTKEDVLSYVVLIVPRSKFRSGVLQNVRKPWVPIGGPPISWCTLDLVVVFGVFTLYHIGFSLQ